MRKNILLILSLTTLFFSCSNKKADLPSPKDCISDTTKKVINVSVADYSFTPSALTIGVNDTVKWTWAGADFHTSTCDGTNGSTLPSGGTSWNSPISNTTGTTYTVAITVPGTYNYVCVIHNTMMKGTIVVKQRCN